MQPSQMAYASTCLTRTFLFLPIAALYPKHKIRIVPALLRDAASLFDRHDAAISITLLEDRR